MAIIAVIFAAIITSCKKENEVTPNGNQNNTPVVVNEKPLSIITRDLSNNRIVIEERFTYQNNQLVKYVKKSADEIDSVIVFQSASQNGFQDFSTFASLPTSVQTLFLSSDKQMHDFTTSNNGITGNFAISNSTISNVVNSANAQRFLIKDAVYENDNIKSFVVNGIGVDTVKVTYDESLGYKKGINELPITFNAMRFFKLLELNNMTSTKMYSKLIKFITKKTNKRTNNFTTHQFSYTFDAKGRIATITDNKSIGTQNLSVDFFENTQKTFTYE